VAKLLNSTQFLTDPSVQHAHEQTSRHWSTCPFSLHSPTLCTLNTGDCQHSTALIPDSTNSNMKLDQT